MTPKLPPVPNVDNTGPDLIDKDVNPRAVNREADERCWAAYGMVGGRQMVRDDDWWGPGEGPGDYKPRHPFYKVVFEVLKEAHEANEPYPDYHTLLRDAKDHDTDGVYKHYNEDTEVIHCKDAKGKHDKIPLRNFQNRISEMKARI